MTKTNHRNLSDVWDEREELFGVGDDSDDENVAGGGSGTGERKDGYAEDNRYTIG